MIDLGFLVKLLLECRCVTVSCLAKSKTLPKMLNASSKPLYQSLAMFPPTVVNLKG